MKGLNIYKDGESINRFENIAARYRILAHTNNFEIFESTIQPGHSILCYKDQSHNALSAYYVLKGSLYNYRLDKKISVGDFFTFKNLEMLHVVSTLEPVQLLVIKQKANFQEQFTKYNGVLELLKAIEKKDKYTKKHCNRTGELAGKLAISMGLSDDKIKNTYLAGKLHDIGKVSIHADILNKPSSLSDTEYKIVKRHPERGYRIIESKLKNGAIGKIVLQHHEKLDGSGYPYGLTHQEIMIESKIITVADQFDAMISKRSYGDVKTIDEAYNTLLEKVDIWYDKKVVEALKILIQSTSINHFK